MALKKSYIPEIDYFSKHCLIEFNDVMYFYYYNSVVGDLATLQISVFEHGRYSHVTLNFQDVGDYSESEHYYPLIYLYCYGN